MSTKTTMIIMMTMMKTVSRLTVSRLKSFLVVGLKNGLENCL